MPELPEVETIRRDLRKHVDGSIIRRIVIRDGRVVRQPEKVFCQELLNRTIKDVQRRGKALLLRIGPGWLVVQPMMTGQLVALRSDQKGRILKATRVVFELSKGKCLLYNDQRLFGRLQFVERLEDLPYLKHMGPELLESSFTPRVFARAIQGRKVAIKSLLLDHRVVAGIGNIYASEVLFRAGISPLRPAGGLEFDEVTKLCRSIKQVLREAIKSRGTSMRNYRDGQGREGKYFKSLKVYGRKGLPCRTCGQEVASTIQSQRSTFFCARCQR